MITDAALKGHTLLRESIVGQQALVSHKLQHLLLQYLTALVTQRPPLAVELRVERIRLCYLLLADIVVNIVHLVTDIVQLLLQALKHQTHLLLKAAVGTESLKQGLNGILPHLFIILTSETVFQCVEVVVDILDQPVEEEIGLCEEVRPHPHEAYLWRYAVAGRVLARPAIDAVSQEVSPQNVLGRQETAGSQHFSPHHLRWLLKIEEVVRTVSCEVHDQGCAAVTSGTPHPLQEIAHQRRRVGIDHGVQAADVDTHLKRRCGYKRVNAVRLRTVLEIVFHLLAHLAVQHAGMLMGIDPRCPIALVDILVIVQC